MIRECEEASNKGNLGEIYEELRRLGNRDSKSREGTNITTEEFAEHFKEVSKDRHERTPGQIYIKRRYEQREISEGRRRPGYGMRS